MRHIDLGVLIFLWAVAAALAAVAVNGGLEHIETTIRSQPTCFPPYFQMEVGSRALSAPTDRCNGAQRWIDNPRLFDLFDFGGEQ